MKKIYIMIGIMLLCMFSLRIDKKNAEDFNGNPRIDIPEIDLREEIRMNPIFRGKNRIPLHYNKLHY